jgi:DNA polymerase-1
MEKQTEFAKANGYVETKYHRKRYIPELNSNNYMVRKFGERAAMNAPIQGTAADIMKIAMIDVYQKLKEQHLQSRIVLQIHDELIIEAPENECEIVSRLLRECMENAADLSVNLDVDLQIGKSWYDTK